VTLITIKTLIVPIEQCWTESAMEGYWVGWRDEDGWMDGNRWQGEAVVFRIALLSRVTDPIYSYIL